MPTNATYKQDSHSEKLEENVSEGMDLDEHQPPTNRTSMSVGDEAWEEHGCILWDLAASKTHAHLMVIISPFCFPIYLICYLSYH